jgi:pseudouridine-5'-phosphate glycosidase
VVPAPLVPLLSPEVAEAQAQGRAVVALETTIVVHGLPAPVNLEVAAACEAAVRASGAVPATVAVLDGRLRVGLSARELAALTDPERRALKLSARDVGPALAAGRDGATTVAGTLAVARVAGIDVMATGGLGGVHRGARESFDESADLGALARVPALVVASGVKSILDIAATLERLDTLGVPVLGYRTDFFPGFYLRATDHRLDWRVEDPAAAAAAFRAHRGLGGAGALLANPVSEDAALDPALHEAALDAALARAEREGVTGKAVTPVLLEEFARFSAGASVAANRALVVANAALAGEVAVALVRGA